MASSPIPGWLTGLLEIAGSDFVKGKRMQGEPGWGGLCRQIPERTPRAVSSNLS